MKRLIALAAGLLLALPAAAPASYYMYRYEAQSATRQIMSDLGYSSTSAQGCHPKGQNRWYRGVSYHAWVCYGIGDESCLVRYRIKGSDSYDYDYTYRSTGHVGDCEYGAW